MSLFELLEWNLSEYHMSSEWHLYLENAKHQGSASGFEKAKHQLHPES